MVRRTVLFVDDERDTRDLFVRQVRGQFHAVVAASPDEAEAKLQESEAPLVVADFRLGPQSGLDLLRGLREQRPELMAILVTGYQDMDTLMEAINSGIIFRFLLKPWRREDLLLLLEQAFDRLDQTEADRRRITHLAELNRYLTEGQSSDITTGGPPMTDVIAAADRVADSNSTVLLRGESGTGKELLARRIHSHSRRSGGPFIAINCGALAEGLLESELFGHERGAFTGAERRHLGKFELAHGGTLFLDEIGDITPRLQIMLLRVLQERRLERVGGSEEVVVDVRVIAATHRALERLVDSGEFRADLYYRLNVFPIRVPSLRQRRDDIPLLARTFLAREARSLGKPIEHITPEALARLTEYEWRGNVRELENVIERAGILCDDRALTADVVERVLGSSRPQADGDLEEDDDELFDEPTQPLALPRPEPRGGGEPAWKRHVQERARGQLEQALIQSEGNRSEAARLLGMKRTTFVYRARKYGLI